jgi:hypothetical protein
MDEATAEPAIDLRHAAPLVTVSFTERPLAEALRDIEVRANTSIVLANQAVDQAKTPITTRFTNTPVEIAVGTLAEMAGLKMVVKGTVLLVTTQDRASELEPPPPPAAPNPALPVVDGSVENLKKKVAELEKTVEELKAKK